MIFRVHKTKDYTIMSNYHLREKNMSLKAKGLLSWMLSNDDDWNYSISGIVACCKENETAIESALDELKQFGYLTVIKLMPNETESGRIEYIYDIHEKPIKQGVENLVLENQVLENQVQRSTKESNTKEEVKNTILKDSTAEPLVDNTKDNLEKETKDIKPKRRILVTDEDFISKSYDLEAKKINEDKKQAKKLNIYEKCLVEIDKYTSDAELRQALKEYLPVRLKITGEDNSKKLLGVGQWIAMLRKLDTFGNQKLKVVQQSTERGWASFFELNDYRYNNHRKPDCSVFGETPQMRSVSPEEVEGGESSGIIF